VAVYINSAGQLGTLAPSSDARIRQSSDLGESSEKPLENELQKQAIKIRLLEDRLAAIEKAHER
jgi:hypothetical protein